MFLDQKLRRQMAGINDDLIGRFLTGRSGGSRLDRPNRLRDVAEQFGLEPKQLTVMPSRQSE